MSTTRPSHDYLTVGAIAALAFITACVAHEAVGHGGACVALGGYVTVLSSVYFRCSSGGPLTDIAGPAMNLALGTFFWAILRYALAVSGQWRLFLGYGMAFNLFWGAGQLVLCAVTNYGDYAFVLRDLALEPSWSWRCGMALLGSVLYLCAARAGATALPSGTPLLLPYVVAGAVGCLAALCFIGGPTLPALREGVQEGFGAGAGLFLVARIGVRQAYALETEPVVRRSNGWCFASVIITLIFLFSFGRGFALSRHT